MPTSCVLCNKRLKVSERRPVNKKVSSYLKKTFLLETTRHDFICGKCNRPAYRPTASLKVQEDGYRSQSNTVPETPTSFPSPPSVCLQIQTTTKSHAYCFVCKRPGPKLVVVPHHTKFNVFVKHNILVSNGSRCCPVHLNYKEDFTADTIQCLKTVDHMYMNRTSILDLLQKLRHTVRKLSEKRQSFSFDDLSCYSDKDILNITGITKQQFLDLYNFILPHVRNTPARSAANTLCIFLMKMKNGLSNRLLATLFATSRSSIRRAVHSVRKSLLLQFVPSHLGFTHISRETVASNHTRTLAQSLFADQDDQVILVLDGTYIYIQKSNNFKFQRRSYSIHKGRPLVKPMVIVTTTGYFVSVLGPYFADAKNNDATILKHLIASNIEQVKDWVKPNDIFIVDRGFRDAVKFLEDMGINTEMPAFMVKGEKQMSSENANASRLVTKVRWVVEAANARIKSWKYLDRILPTNQVPFIRDYVRIVCALINKYSRPIATDYEHDRELAEKMKAQSQCINSLKLEVEQKFSNRKSCNWQKIDNSSLADFPCLDESEMRNITCGSYQLKMSCSYIQEHLEGTCDIKIHKKDDHLVLVKIQSRHVSSKSYHVWVRYSESAIEAWYCKCRAGARVEGVCSHVAAVLWYLGYARHNEMKSVGVRDWGEHLDDAVLCPESVDTSSRSDSDDSVVILVWPLLQYNQ